MHQHLVVVEDLPRVRRLEQHQTDRAEPPRVDLGPDPGPFGIDRLLHPAAHARKVGRPGIGQGRAHPLDAAGGRAPAEGQVEAVQEPAPQKVGQPPAGGHVRPRGDRTAGQEVVYHGMDHASAEPAGRRGEAEAGDLLHRKARHGKAVGEAKAVARRVMARHATDHRSGVRRDEGRLGLQPSVRPQHPFRAVLEHRPRGRDERAKQTAPLEFQLEAAAPRCSAGRCPGLAGPLPDRCPTSRRGPRVGTSARTPGRPNTRFQFSSRTPLRKK